MASPATDHPLPPPPRSPIARLTELRTGREAIRLLALAPRLRRAPKGNGRGAILCPGFGTDDYSMVPLRSFLRNRNHDARGWEAGRNTGDVVRYTDEMVARAEAVVADTGRPVNMIGWSLGGVYALEVGRERPDLVNRVVHFGTPLRGPRYTAAASAYGENAIQEIEKLIDERTQIPLRVPVLSLYSKRDGVVDYPTSYNNEAGDVRNMEVSSSHLGLGFDPDVWNLIAHFLAED